MLSKSWGQNFNSLRQESICLDHASDEKIEKNLDPRQLHREFHPTWSRQGKFERFVRKTVPQRCPLGYSNLPRQYTRWPKPDILSPSHFFTMVVWFSKATIQVTLYTLHTKFLLDGMRANAMWSTEYVALHASIRCSTYQRSPLLPCLTLRYSKKPFPTCALNKGITSFFNFGFSWIFLESLVSKLVSKSFIYLLWNRNPLLWLRACLCFTWHSRHI